MIKPTRGYVLIEPDKADESVKTTGGVSLYLPESAQEKPQKGTVVEIGDLTAEQIKATGVTRSSDYIHYKKGAKVYYRRWNGDEIKEDGKEYKIVKFEDIIAVIE